MLSCFQSPHGVFVNEKYSNDQPCNKQQCHLGTLQTVWFLTGHDKNHKGSHHLSVHAAIFPPILQVLRQHLEHGTDYEQSEKLKEKFRQYRQWNVEQTTKRCSILF
jgi:hypothetical protein